MAFVFNKFAFFDHELVVSSIRERQDVQNILTKSFGNLVNSTQFVRPSLCLWCNDFCLVEHLQGVAGIANPGEDLAEDMV